MASFVFEHLVEEQVESMDVQLCTCASVLSDQAHGLDMFSACNVCIGSSTTNVEVEMEMDPLDACPRCGSVATWGPQGIERYNACDWCISGCKDVVEFQVINEEAESNMVINGDEENHEMEYASDDDGSSDDDVVDDSDDSDSTDSDYNNSTDNDEDDDDNSDDDDEDESNSNDYPYRASLLGLLGG